MRPACGGSLWVLLAAAVVFLVFYGLAQQTPSVPMSTVQQATHYVRGRVIEVTDNAWQGQQDYEDIPVGKQTGPRGAALRQIPRAGLGCRTSWYLYESDP